MSLGVQGVLSRITELNQQLGLAPPQPPDVTGTDPAGGTAFASALTDARGAGTAAPGSGDRAGIQTVGATPAPSIQPAGALSGLSASSALAALRPAALQNGSPLAGVPYADLFVQAGAKYGVSPKLLAAIAQVESGYDPRALSSGGAQGLMQLMPGTARGLGVQDSFDPQDAIMGGAKLLAQNLREFKSVPLALAAYNAGGGAVHRYGGIPPFAETQAYVPRVQNALAALGG
jgi:soluble lytic murein transglycosylase-like protein